MSKGAELRTARFFADSSAIFQTESVRLATASLIPRWDRAVAIAAV